MSIDFDQNFLSDFAMESNRIEIVADLSFNCQGPPLVINHNDPSAITVFKSEIMSEPWITWENQAEIMKITLNGEMHELDPDYITKKHPLDAAAGSKYDSNREDLNEIRQQYDEIIQNMPILEKLRSEHDKLRKKHKLFDAIKGEDDAAI